MRHHLVLVSALALAVTGCTVPQALANTPVQTPTQQIEVSCPVVVNIGAWPGQEAPGITLGQQAYLVDHACGWDRSGQDGAQEVTSGGQNGIDSAVRIDPSVAATGQGTAAATGATPDAGAGR
jgi:hypothetical protein